MLNMSDIYHIRYLGRCGYRVSEISEATGHDSKTIKKYLKMEDFSMLPAVKIGRPSILDPFKPTILQWLREDRERWHKQRHTAKRIYNRLVKEKGYTGSYDTVQKYVKDVRITTTETGTQELTWHPAEAQVDFGEADFMEDTTVRRRKYLVVSFPYSNDSFTQVFGGENAECVCQGLEDIFEYIGGVPLLLVFDNATGVGKKIGDKVFETELFRRFHLHYGFRVRFCNPYAGYEKGNVESKVGYTRRNLFVPIERYHSMEEYNLGLLDRHQTKASESHYKKGTRISDLFEEDRKNLMSLPSKKFDVVTYDWYKADGYGKVCLDRCHYYSTRPEYHRQKVLIGKRAHYVDVLRADGSLLVRHKRKYGEDRTDVSDYSTTLETLWKNAGAWENIGLREDLPDPLRDYIDGLDRRNRREQLHLMSDLNNEYGYQAAVQAMTMALNHGEIHSSDARVLAERITGYGIESPPDAGPSLEVYDEAFLSGGSRGDSV